MSPHRIRLIVGEVRVSGMSSLDARRLVDRLEVEFVRLAPQLSKLAASRDHNHVDLGNLRTTPRIELSAAPVASAVFKALLP
jgi:hypothetical protein